MTTISIIGAGWLGKPLATCLQNLGHNVYASRTSLSKLSELSEVEITGFVTDLNQQNNDDLSQTFMAQQTEVVIGCFPPGFRKGAGTQYAEQWRYLTAQAKLANVRKLIMISSTTVYPSLASDMTEDQASYSLAHNHDYFSDNAKIMLQAEKSVIESGLEYTVIRCSGLIGPQRHPARFATRLKQVSSSAPANMLHLTDAIGVASYFATNPVNAVVNATTPNTVSKAQFYQAAIDATDSKLPLPPVVDVPDKRIVSDLVQSFGYKFHYNHVLEAIAAIGDKHHG